MDLNQKSSADHIIEHLLAIDVDGETMEYIINGTHMEHQMLKQLMMKSSDFNINNVLEERDSVKKSLNVTITDEQIADACNKAYLKSGHNAYFGNGFESGVKFALEQVKNYLLK